MKTLPGILVAALLVAHVCAQTATPVPKSSPSPSPGEGSGTRHSLKYVPPKNAASGTRKGIDAGTRGWTDKLPSIYVLAPDHVGLTTQAQPTLFWYQSGPTNIRMEFTLIIPHKPGWLLRVATENADQPGIHRLSLEKYHITLTPGVTYRWSVALVPNPNGRSEDLIASDLIQRVEPEARLGTALAGKTYLDKAGLYAANGIWYDALKALTDELDTTPSKREIHVLRASLLDQAGLNTPAASERR